MWKNELRMAERLPETPDVLIVLASVLQHFDMIGKPGTESIIYFFEKPYKYQREYEILLDVAKKYGFTGPSGPDIMMLTDYSEEDYEKFAVEAQNRLMGR